MNNLSADMVSRIEFDEKEQECLAKEEQIQVRLDHLASIESHCLCRFYRRKFVGSNIYCI
jgi:hypothetical protein